MNSVSMDNQKVRKNHTTTWFDRLARKMVFSMLERLEVGHLILEENGSTYFFGEDKDNAKHIAHIHVHDINTYRDVFLNSSIGAGEAYMKGGWTSPDVVAVIRLMVVNLNLIN
ncbi:MAG: SAM-dependent methyltransferase, partial [Marinomonas sp.]